MQYRSAGDWQVSAIGFGCYGLSGEYGQVDSKAYRKTIHQAFEMGINYFDTAEGYGGAESFLGEVLAPFRDQVFIATKLSGESGMPDLSTGVVQKACEGSLKRLGVDVIDLYQIHFDDPQTPILETVEALESLIAQGKIRQYGICHLPLARAAEYARVGRPFSILMELSPVARTSLDTLLPLCQAHDLAAIAFSVTGRGILADRFGPGYAFDAEDIRRMDPLFKHDRIRSALRIRRKLTDFGQRYDATAVQMGIAWVLAQPQVTCALTGTASAEHLAENAAAAEITLDSADLDALRAFFQDEDARLAAEEVKTIHDLLHSPLPEDPESAFNDLVYVLETAIINGMVHEGEVIPVFKELFALRKTLDQDAKRKMMGIQVILKEMIASL